LAVRAEIVELASEHAGRSFRVVMKYGMPGSNVRGSVVRERTQWMERWQSGRSWCQATDCGHHCTFSEEASFQFCPFLKPSLKVHLCKVGIICNTRIASAILKVPALRISSEPSDVSVPLLDNHGNIVAKLRLTFEAKRPGRPRGCLDSPITPADELAQKPGKQDDGMAPIFVGRVVRGKGVPGNDAEGAQSPIAKGVPVGRRGAVLLGCASNSSPGEYHAQK